MPFFHRNIFFFPNWIFHNFIMGHWLIWLKFVTLFKQKFCLFHLTSKFVTDDTPLSLLFLVPFYEAWQRNKLPGNHFKSSKWMSKIRIAVDIKSQKFIHKILKWMVQCHEDVNKNSRLRLEYSYLLFNEFRMNRINLEMIKKWRILMSFLVTESSCDDCILRVLLVSQTQNLH